MVTPPTMRDPRPSGEDATDQGTYGVRIATRNGDEFDVIREALSRNGFAVVPDVLARAQLESYRAALDTIYSRQCSEVGGEENLQKMSDADVARCLLAYDPQFLSLATHPMVMDLCRRILGDNYVLLMQNGVLNRPTAEHYQRNWHRDLNYQHWVSSRPLAISALFCLDDFSATTGGTEFLPGSHLQGEFPSEAFARDNLQTADASPGSVIVMDAMVFHRAGRNRSQNVRRGVNHVIGVPILAQQVSIPDMLHGQHAEDPFLSRYLGYRWAPKRDVRSWRLARIEGSSRHG
jgi:ectoine hydroxylase-related dioxygenase (phytanoyl-CoA dioxygenase family)